MYQDHYLYNSQKERRVLISQIAGIHFSFDLGVKWNILLTAGPTGPGGPWGPGGP